MPTPDPHGHAPNPHRPAGTGSPGYEVTDASVSGIVIFLMSLAVCSAVIFVVCYGIGRVLNTAMVKHDGPANKWHALPAPPSTGKNLASDAVLEQEELAGMTQRFPTPRLQMDDGDQDVADLHAREDLLLDHYSWVDRQQGKVRIPISRAMQLLAQDGLPVAPASQSSEPLMTADRAPEVPAPLTDGFARTSYEQQQLATLEQQRLRGEKSPEQAALGANR
jgi:hypothetical protein